MSKRFTKILTICSLVLVIPAIVIASAICLSTAFAVKVSVDTFIDNDIYGLSQVSDVTINGEMVSSVQVQKGKKVQITFSTKGLYADFVKISEGSKDECVGAEALDVKIENDRATYVVENVKNDMRFTVVYQAPVFHKITVASNPVNENITVGVKGPDVHNIQPNTYVAKDSTVATLTQEVKDNTEKRYSFNNWTQTEGEKVELTSEYSFVATHDVAFTANYSDTIVHTITLKAEFDEEVEGGSYEFEVTGDNLQHPQENVWTVDENKAANVSVENIKGYNFAGWYNEKGEQVAEGATTFQTPSMTQNIVYTAKFTAIKYNKDAITFSYHGTTEKNSDAVKYGTNISEFAPQVPDYYDNGWHKFIGWKNDKGETVTTATFDGAENITLTAAYWNQSDVTYNLTIPAITHIANAGTMTYKVGEGFKTSGCDALRDFYLVKGIKVGNTEYNFDELGKTTISNTEALDKALADLTTDLGATEITVDAQLVWEWSFKSVKIMVAGNLDLSVSFERDKEHDSIDLDFDLISFLNAKGFGPYKNVTKIEASVSGADSDKVGGPIKDYKTLADLLFNLEGSFKDKEIIFTLTIK